jgi:RNA polymerase sigma-70 factor (ECF subfamily)
VVTQLLSPEDALLVEGLRAGDEAAFAAVMRMYGRGMLRVAEMYVSSRAVAEDVVQEAWVGVLRGIGRFEGRSSLKTWLYRIVANTAKTRGVRESRSVPFSSLGEDGDEGTVDADRFLGSGDRFPGHWAVPPQAWAPEGRLLADETLEVVERAIEKLPPAQRAVITMRDVQGFTSEEVCNALDLTETNQRVLLHRARAKVRGARGVHAMRLDRELVCQDVVELVTAYLDDALLPDDRERFEEHLVFCDGCQNYLDQMRGTIKAGGRVRVELPADLQEKLLEAFRGWRET